MQTMTQEEFLAEARARFGDKVTDWKFVCPMCGTIQSVGQLADAVVAAGEPRENTEKYIGFSCIGRFTGQGDAGITAKSRGKSWDKGCNWTLGGLFRLHKLEVIVEGGNHRPTFELAPAT